MKSYPARFLLLFLLVAIIPGWAADVSPIISSTDGTYRVTAKASHKFTRNVSKLKDAAMDAANQFCAKEGKQLKVVSVKETKSQYLVGDFAQITLTFKALAGNDPELAASASPAAPVYIPVAAPKPITTDELQSELTKLDEMRKKGLLTDAEFDALKQKLLSRF